MSRTTEIPILSLNPVIGATLVRQRREMRGFVVDCTMRDENGTHRGYMELIEKYGYRAV